MSDYKETVWSGIATRPWPTEMEALFGEGDDFITEYGFSAEPRVWSAEIYFCGRYRLTMQVGLEVDYDNHIVTKHTSPPNLYCRRWNR
jgi:hypothetical protein